MLIPVACPCVLWSWLCFYPFSVLRGSFFLFDRNDRRPQGGRASPSASQPWLAQLQLLGNTVCPRTDRGHTHTHMHIHSLSHFLSRSKFRAADVQPSASILPILQSAGLPSQPSCGIHSGHSATRLPCQVPRFQLPGWAPYCRPQFSSYSCRVARYGRYEPVRRGSGLSLQHPYRIRAVRCWAVHTPTCTRTRAATPTGSLSALDPNEPE